jgi:P27 family predicted phage terminase small subunit
MRGRKPTPSVLRFLRNNPGKRPMNKNEPQPDPMPVSVPEELDKELARAEWKRTIIPAIERGQITSGDRAHAIAHCCLWEQWRSQSAEADKHPHIVAVGPNKHPIPNPARGMANKTLMMLTKIDAELGLTPSSRSRVNLLGGGSERQMSKVDQFRQRKTGA